MLTRTILVIALLFGTAVAHAQTPRTAEGAVATLRTILTLRPRASDLVLDDVNDPETMNYVAQSMRDVVASFDPNEGVFWDADLFTSSQEYNTFKIVSLNAPGSPTDAGVVVAATLKVDKSPTDTSKPETFFLARMVFENGSWKLANIVYPEDTPPLDFMDAMTKAIRKANLPLKKALPVDPVTGTSTTPAQMAKMKDQFPDYVAVYMVADACAAAGAVFSRQTVQAMAGFMKILFEDLRQEEKDRVWNAYRMAAPTNPHLTRGDCSQAWTIALTAFPNDLLMTPEKSPF